MRSAKRRMMKPRISKPTSGHPQKQNEQSRRPEVGLGILGFIIRRFAEHMKSMQNSFVFIVFLTHREIRSDFETSTVKGTGARSTFP